MLTEIVNNILKSLCGQNITVQNLVNMVLCWYIVGHNLLKGIAHDADGQLLTFSQHPNKLMTPFTYD